MISHYSGIKCIYLYSSSKTSLGLFPLHLFCIWELVLFFSMWVDQIVVISWWLCFIVFVSVTILSWVVLLLFFFKWNKNWIAYVCSMAKGILCILFFMPAVANSITVTPTWFWGRNNQKYCQQNKDCVWTFCLVRSYHCSLS